MKKLARKIIQDALTYVLIMGPWTITLLWIIFLMLKFSLPAWIWVLLFPPVFILFYLFSIFIFRCLLPKLRKGVYTVGFNLGFLTWYAHSMLSRSARVVNLHYFLHAFSFTRFLYWRALGAKVNFFTDSSYKIVIHDFPLIEIGEGCLLAEDVELSGHLITGDRLFVAPVKLGRKVFVGRTTYIGPRTVIGDNSWIGMGHYLHNKTFAPYTKLESVTGPASSP